MKYTSKKWKLKKILSCHFEEKSKDQATTLPWTNLSLFSLQLGAQKKNRVSDVFEDLSPRFKVYYVCFYRKESLFCNGNLINQHGVIDFYN